MVWPADLTDVIYTILVQDYLAYFLPPGMSQNPTATRGGGALLFVLHRKSSPSLRTNIAHFFCQFELFPSRIILNQINRTLLPCPGNSLPNQPTAQHNIGRFMPASHSLSQAFAEILIEMWLNQRGNETHKVILSMDQVRRPK